MTAAHDRVDVDGERDDREHREGLHEAMDDVVVLEAVGVEGEAAPSPRDRDEEGREAHEHGGCGFAAQRRGDL